MPEECFCAIRKPQHAGRAEGGAAPMPSTSTKLLFDHNSWLRRGVVNIEQVFSSVVLNLPTMTLVLYLWASNRARRRTLDPGPPPG